MTESQPNPSPTELGTLLTGSENNEERKEIVVLYEDGEVATEERTYESTMARSFAASAADTLSNDIRGFLARPHITGAIDWPSTAVKGQRLLHSELPGDFFFNNMIKEKIAGFRFLRCDFKIRVQVNAQPFNAGRLLLVYVPVLYTLENKGDDLSSLGSLSGITGYPHVDLDLSTSTSAEITIPFIPVYSHYDLIDGRGASGVFYLYVYSPLTGSTDADITIWTWADNIDIQLPTGLPLAPLPVGLTGQAQAGRKAERKRPGTVETVAGVVGSIATNLSGVPIIGEVAKATSWVADAVGGIASFFGWSKPADPEFTTKVETGFGRHLCNYNGDAKTKSFGLDVRNETDIPVEVFKTTVDEMAINHIVGKPVYMDSFTMDNTQLPNTMLWKWPAEPNACNRVNWTEPASGPGVGVIAHNTFLSYLSNIFRFWRGTLRYTFKVVKTPFHSGRVRVFLVPGANWDTDPATIDFDKVYSQVYDLRETNEFTLDVPFKWNALWKAINPQPNLSAPTEPCYDDPIAMIYIRVVNALKNPSTAANSIDFLVEVSGGEDFQFSFPTTVFNSKIIPYATGLPTLCNSGKAQIGDIIPAPKMTELDANAMAIGEVVTSLRQVLKRYWKIPINAVLPDTPSKFINPLVTYWSTKPVPGNAEVGKIYYWQHNMYDWISNLFRFRSGSVRLGICNKTISTSSTSEMSIVPNCELAMSAEVYPPDPLLPHLEDNTRPIIFQCNTFEPFAEFHIPFYQLWPAIPTETGLPILNYGTGDRADVPPQVNTWREVPWNPGTFVQLLNTDNPWLQQNFYSSIGEDFSLGFLTGPPMTMYFTAAPTPPPSI